MSKKRVDQNLSRRHFLNSLGIGTAGLLVVGSYGFTIRRDPQSGKIKAIVVDFEKCAGCRTCEAVCSAFNHKVEVDGKKINGSGNPALSNIRVFHYNPDIDIPSTCAICEDAPCVKACPVEPDPDTGHKALYRNKEIFTISCDTERCIGCQSCYFACKEQRAGVIRSNPETGSPEMMCTLCEGDPQCVLNCPYDALSYIEMNSSRDLDHIAPEVIAKQLIKKIYNLNLEEV